MAPFSEHVDTFCPTVPKMDENFFGEAFGCQTPKNTIKIDFSSFLGGLGPIFQKIKI